jgi:hypothetical protein
LLLSPVPVETEERSSNRAIAVQVNSFTANFTSLELPQYLLKDSFKNSLATPSVSQHWRVWLASLFLVSVPVFFEAPLVRFAPALSLIFTVGWLAIAKQMQADAKSQVWGSLIWGFSLTWLCGSIYWGWLRWEPAYHVPVEALALPWALWAIRRDSHRVGGWFYIGSLLGTTITDLYFFIAQLFPHWQALMQVEANNSLAQPILKNALSLVETPWGIGWAVILAVLLLTIGNKAMRSPNLSYWAFAGAVLGTILVDLLFFGVAILG